MPRKRTGSKEFKNGHWVIKLTVDLRGGGTERRSVILPAGTGETDAESKRISLAAKAAGRVFAPSERVEQAGSELTFEAYVETWLKSRVARGLRSVRKDRQRLKDHVAPVLGAVAMRDVTADRLRDVVSALDAKVRDPEQRFAWLTASKTWGAVTKLFRDAAGSKERALRVLTVNPCLGVEGPDRGTEKEAQWLFPSEFATLVACAEVPVRWRRIYSVAVYLYLRLSEARALHWEDLDLVHGMARIHRSTDERGQRVREHTKTSSVRHFRIEPALRPLLNAMALEGAATGRLFDSIDDAAGELRAHLLRAGVKREALHKATATSLALRFHDLRATGITWAALRGDAPIEIRDRAGHAELEQTNDYMRRASGAGDVGPPFPELGSLFDSVPRSVPEPESSRSAREKLVRRGGLEVPSQDSRGEILEGSGAPLSAGTAGPVPQDNSGDDSRDAFAAAVAEDLERAEAAAVLRRAPAAVHMVTVTRRGRKGAKRDAG